MLIEAVFGEESLAQVPVSCMEDFHGAEFE
jgi:hypothetical protein